jgi:hypothetical protein
MEQFPGIYLESSFIDRRNEICHDSLSSCTIYEYVIPLAAFILYEAGILGITAGAHRLWSHRAYKAKWPMRLILMLFHTSAFQVDDFLHIVDGCEDHYDNYYYYYYSIANGLSTRRQRLQYGTTNNIHKQLHITTTNNI